MISGPQGDGKDEELGESCRVLCSDGALLIWLGRRLARIGLWREERGSPNIWAQLRRESRRAFIDFGHGEKLCHGQEGSSLGVDHSGPTVDWWPRRPHGRLGSFSYGQWEVMGKKKIQKNHENGNRQARASGSI